jgi:peroxiredoxin
LSDEGLKTALAYGVAMDGDEIAVPSVFVIDKNMRIRFKYVGESISDRPSVSEIIAEAEKVKGTQSP